MNNGKTNSNWTSFSLLNLMALATIVAVWLPRWISRDEPERLRTEIDLMNQSLGLLVVNDPSKFQSIRMANFGSDIETWRFHVPDDMNIEACLAIQGIHDLALPQEFKRFKLPSGQHEMSLRFRNHRDKGFNFQVHLDGDLELKMERPVEWFDSGGWSSSGGIGVVSAVHDVGNPLIMKKLVYNAVISTKSSGTIYLRDDSAASSKGCCLWLQPVDQVRESAPDWVDETTSLYPKQLGLREGVRLRPQVSGSPGLQIHHPHCLTNEVPVVTVFMEFESDEADVSLDTRNQNTGTWKFSGLPHDFAQPKFVAENQRQQSFYLIHEINEEKLSTAKPPVPIVEILFDLDHPDDIGLRLVPPDKGLAVDRWKIRAVHHLGQYWQTLVTKEGQWDATDDPSTLELTSLPELQYREATHRVIEIQSPAEDLVEWDKLEIPRGMRFASYPQRHSWLLPKATDADGTVTRLSVQVSGGEEDSASTPIPGGPVISELILDIENPNDAIHWYRVDVQPFNE